MANRDTITKIIDIQIPYDRLVKAVIEVDNSLEGLRKNLKENEAQFKNGEISSSEYKRNMIELNAQIKALKAEQKSYNKEIQNNITIQTNAEGSNKRLKALLANLTIQYDSLSDAQREASDGVSLSKHINEVTTALNKSEQSIGVFNRNVGNYKSGFDGLGMSIAQLTREAPAFANSMSTGFMAISNNIPMLVDEINKLKAANAAMNAEGIKTPSVFSSIVKSFLSWNTLISVGVTLLTVYGKDIVNWAVSLFKVENALKGTTYAATQFNKVMTEGAQSAQSELTRLKTLRSVTEDTTRSIEDRTAAAEELQRLYPSYLGNVSTEDLLLGKVNTQYDNLSISIMKAAKSKAAMDVITKNLSTQLEIENTKGAKEYLKQYEIRQKLMADAEKERLKYDGRTTAATQSALKDTELRMDYNLKLFKESNKELFEEIKKSGLSLGDYFNSLSSLNNDLTPVASEGITIDTGGENKEEKEAERKAKILADFAQKAKDQKLTELKEYQTYEDLLISMMRDGADKQIKELQTTADRQIQELRNRLATETNLTVGAKKAINDQILLLEGKLATDIQTITDNSTKEALQKEINRKTTEIQIRLGIAKKGSEEELTLILEQLKLQQDEEIRKAEETGVSLLLIDEKYRKLREDATNTAKANTLNQERSEMEERIQQIFLLAGEEGNAKLLAEEEAAQMRLDRLLGLDAEEKEALGMSNTAYTNAVRQAEKDKQDAINKTAETAREAEMQQLQAAGAIFGAMSDLFNGFAEDNEALADFAKMLALFEIGANLAVGISGAVAAGSGLMFPANLAAIASGVAAVTAAILSAKKVLEKSPKPKKPKFHEGGLVQGAGEVDATLLAGETVMTRRATQMFAPMLSAMNLSAGGNAISISNLGDGLDDSSLERIIKKAVSELPPPVVSVVEITNTQKRIQVMDNLVNI